MDTPKIEILSSGAPVAETHGRCFLPEGAPFTIRVSFAKESPMLSQDVSFGVLLWTGTLAPHDRKPRKIYSAMFRREDLEPSDVGLSHSFLGTYKGHDDEKIQLSFRNGLTVATCQCCGPPVTETFSYCILHMVVMKVRNSVVKGLDATYGKNTTGRDGEVDNLIATINPRAKLSRPTIHPPLSRKNSSIPPPNAEHTYQLTSSAIQTNPTGYVADPAERVRPYGKLLPPSAANPEGPVGAKVEDSYVLVPPSGTLPSRSGGVGSGEGDKGGELQTVSEGEDEGDFQHAGDELMGWEIV
ncbi:MAG: hypothetical protein Q9203_007568 [Teloschistes exilis]